MIAGLILAGGASQRFGQPKALLRLGTESFLSRLYRLLSTVCADVWIVTGTHDSEIRLAEPALQQRMVFNEHHLEGQFSSLQCGLGRIADAADVMFSPVDYAAVSEDTLTLLAAQQGSAEVLKPRFEGQSGHPVLVSRSAAHALRQGLAGANAKEILSRCQGRYLDCLDPFCASDVDTIEDYRQLMARWTAAQ